MPVSRGAAFDYLSREYGGAFRDYDEVVAVNTTQVQLAGGDTDRVSLIVANLGANPIWMSPRPPVSSTRGIRVGAGGGLVGFNLSQDGLLCAVPWWAIALVGPNDVFVIRVRRESITPAEELGP
jgi:hypothetical protein